MDMGNLTFQLEINMSDLLKKISLTAMELIIILMGTGILNIHIKLF